MFRNLAALVRYRGLIQSLVARDLKARYRGSFLGFFWSFINPLMLLLVYSFVFKNIMPADYRGFGIEHYEVFLFCGLLPWTFVPVYFFADIIYLPPFYIILQRLEHLAAEQRERARAAEAAAE